MFAITTPGPRFRPPLSACCSPWIPSSPCPSWICRSRGRWPGRRGRSSRSWTPRRRGGGRSRRRPTVCRCPPPPEVSCPSASGVWRRLCPWRRNIFVVVSRYFSIVCSVPEWLTTNRSRRLIISVASVAGPNQTPNKTYIYCSALVRRLGGGGQLARSPGILSVNFFVSISVWDFGENRKTANAETVSRVEIWICQSRNSECLLCQ